MQTAKVTTSKEVQIRELARRLKKKLELQGLDSARATTIALAIARQKLTATDMNEAQKRLCLICQTYIKNAQISHY